MDQSPRVEVRLCSLAGSTVELLLPRDESVISLRQRASEPFGISSYQLQLLRGGEPFPKLGSLRDHLGDGASLELTVVAVPMATCREVAVRSELLYFALKHAEERPQKTFWRYRLEQLRMIQEHGSAMEQGDVHFMVRGRNLLEMALRTCLDGPDMQKIVGQMLEGGVDVNAPSADGSTPLVAACSQGLGRIARRLVQRGAKPCKKALNGAVRFFRAGRPQEAAEDLELARLCCAFRRQRVEEAREKGELSPVEATRLQLSQAALELSLWGPLTQKLTKQAVVARSGLEEGLDLSRSSGVWDGWPVPCNDQ